METTEEPKRLKIAELKDKQGNVDMDVKIIWDKAEPEQKFGKTIKSVIVADADSEEGGATAYLDLYDKDAEAYKSGDKIRVINAYAKLIQNKKGQFRITNAHEVQMIEAAKEEEVDTEQENNLLAEWITRNYGERCKDYNPSCHLCKAWDYYAKLKYD